MGRTGRQRWGSRREALEAIKARLQSKGLPRLQMSLMLMLTGACGFLSSFALLHLGLTRMWLRYPLAVLCAYVVFLLLLRLWLAYQCNRVGRLGLDLDLSSLRLPSFNFGFGSWGGGGGKSFSLGGGSDFGGGGAGGSWATENVAAAATVPQPTGGGLGLGNIGGGLSKCDFDLDLDDGWVVIAIVLLVVAALALVLLSVYLIYIAPALLAEVFLDGALVTGLYKRLPQEEGTRNWLRVSVRRTWWLVVIFILLLGAAGYAMQRVAPEARSIGGVWTHIHKKQ